MRGAENMASMRAVGANCESVSDHYLASLHQGSLIVEIKEEIQKELQCLQQKRLHGKEYLHNVPLFHGVNNLTRMALKGLNEQGVV
ncbi:MAG TPA: hypothetical protein VLH18_01905 [Candidatus Limnocylindrales bacterium]|nr:hypothetical protein [Candidatus Limnocylindrales bacterium]